MAKIRRKDFLDELAKVAKIVPNSTTLEIIKGVLIETGNSNMKLSATNTVTSIVINTPCETGMIDKESYIVDAKILHDIVRKIGSDEIDISVNNDRVTIKGGNSKFNLAPMGSKEMFPEIKNINSLDQGKTITISEESLKELVAKTIPFISFDETRPILGGVKLEFTKEQVTGVSLDGYRLAHKVSTIDSDIETSFIVPASALSDIAKTITCDVKLQYSEENRDICFAFDNTTIYVKELDGKFIDYSGFLERNYDTKIVVEQQQLKNAIDRIMIISKTDPATLEFNDKTLSIISNNQIGKVSETVEIKELEGKKPEYKIGFNPKYLLDGLKVLEEENIALSLQDSLQPMFITTNDDYTYMLLPIRLSNAD